MKPGDIFQFTNNRIRILMLDDNEIFYGTVNQDGIFDYAKYKTISYYRTPRDFFEKNSRFIDSMKLSETEIEIHRPDLPLRLNCFKNTFWTTELFKNLGEFEEFLNKTGIQIDNLEGIEISKINIVPTSQQNSHKKPVLIESNEEEITGKDLLFQCFNIQREYVKFEKPYFSRFRLIPGGREEKRLTGIGLYRLGIKGNIPSYYIGGEVSMMELESKKEYIV